MDGTNKKATCLTGILIIAVFLIGGIASIHQETAKAGTVDQWKLIEKKSVDMDKDGHQDQISISFSNPIAPGSVMKMKISINKAVRTFTFDPAKSFAPVSMEWKQIVRLGNGHKGILVKLNSSGESTVKGDNNPIYFYDHNFMILGYEKDSINVLLYGADLPICKAVNFKVRYVPDYKIEFMDKTAKLHAIYEIPLYRTMSDGLRKLREINTRDVPAALPYNYFSVKAKDLDHDGIEEIYCSKYIPGVYHADILGTVEYGYSRHNGKYAMTSAVFRYEGNVFASRKITLH